MTRLEKGQWQKEQEARIRSKLPKAEGVKPLTAEETLRQAIAKMRRDNPLPTEDDFRVIVGPSPFPDGRIPKDFNDPLT